MAIGPVKDLDLFIVVCPGNINSGRCQPTDVFFTLARIDRVQRLFAQFENWQSRVFQID